MPDGRRNPRYGQPWRASLIADLRKMKTDARIRHAALAVVVFNDTRATIAAAAPFSAAATQELYG